MEERTAGKDASGGPSAPGGRYPPEAPAEGCGARETWGPGSASSPYGLLASTPHIAAAPLIMLLACGQAGGLQTHRERQRSSQDSDMMIEKE